ncbi:MAG: hypothetical protein NTX56_03940 [Proteobacteria bacterium]|nr:hypothetical protein [Pseudomonadota bacterium]
MSFSSSASGIKFGVMMTADRTLELRREILFLRKRVEKQRKSIVAYQKALQEYVDRATRDDAKRIVE